MFKIKKLLQKAIENLKKKNIPQPELEAQIIMANVLNCDRIHLLIDLDKEINKNQKNKFEKYVNLRMKNYPLFYIIGKKEFMGIEFIISPDVFIPRQETEFLVEEVIRLNKNRNSRILDIGTGCGNIAVSIAKFIPGADITGIDISKKSIEIARLNSKRQNVCDRVKFICDDFLRFKKNLNINKRFDFIVSNPPYVAGSEFKFLQREIFYEPRIALYAGEDGLFFYREIADFSKKYLKRNGLTIVELSYNNSEKVIDIFRNMDLRFIKTVKDYFGFERVAVFKKIYG